MSTVSQEGQRTTVPSHACRRRSHPEHWWCRSPVQVACTSVISKGKISCRVPRPHCHPVCFPSCFSCRSESFGFDACWFVSQCHQTLCGRFDQRGGAALVTLLATTAEPARDEAFTHVLTSCSFVALLLLFVILSCADVQSCQVQSKTSSLNGGQAQLFLFIGLVRRDDDVFNGDGCRMLFPFFDRARPMDALALERLLNQGIHSSDVADQFLWECVADPQVGDAGRTDPYSTILTLPDERFEGQIKRQEWRSNHQWRATFRIAEDQHVGFLHLQADAFCFSAMVNMGKEGQLSPLDCLLEARQRLLDSKRAGSGHNALDRGRSSRCWLVHGSHLSPVLMKESLVLTTARDAAQAVTAACAAVSMSCTTSSGWETIATWFVGTSTVAAPMRLANRRSASGGMAWSPSATRDQDGSAFQAGTPITSCRRSRPTAAARRT